MSFNYYTCALKHYFNVTNQILVLIYEVSLYINKLQYCLYFGVLRTNYNILYYVSIKMIKFAINYFE